MSCSVGLDGNIGHQELKLNLHLSLYRVACARGDRLRCPDIHSRYGRKAGGFNSHSVNQRSAGVPAGSIEDGRFHVQTFAAGRHGHLPLVSESEACEETLGGIDAGKNYANGFRWPRKSCKSCQQHRSANSTTMKRRSDHAEHQPNVIGKQARDSSNPSNRDGLFVGATDNLQVTWVLQKLLELPNPFGKRPGSFSL